MVNLWTVNLSPAGIEKVVFCDFSDKVRAAYERLIGGDEKQL